MFEQEPLEGVPALLQRPPHRRGERGVGLRPPRAEHLAQHGLRLGLQLLGHPAAHLRQHLQGLRTSRRPASRRRRSTSSSSSSTTRTYGGSGGAIAVASTHASAVELVLHESGHTFGLLADEYTESPPACSNTSEPAQANVTRQTARAAIKWNAWIDAPTPLPTVSTQPGLVGLYEGARYCTTGLYRPTFNSKMRTLGAALRAGQRRAARPPRLQPRLARGHVRAGERRPVQLTTGQAQNFSVTTARAAHARALGELDD